LDSFHIHAEGRSGSLSPKLSIPSIIPSSHRQEWQRSAFLEETKRSNSQWEQFIADVKQKSEESKQMASSLRLHELEAEALKVGSVDATALISLTLLLLAQKFEDVRFAEGTPKAAAKTAPPQREYAEIW
jgi:hypothetical protein